MKRLSAVALLALLVAGLYLPTLHHDFVFDDEVLVANNPTLQEGSAWANVLGALDVETRPATERDHGLDPGYRPLRTLSYALDIWVHGTSEPWAFRLTNMFLHLCCALFVGLLGRFLGGRYVGFVAAVVFAVHPLQTESVTYISGRRDVLFALFYLAALWVFLRGRAHGFTWRSGLGVCALFAASLATKEMAVTLPVVCVIYDVALRGWRPLRLWWRWLFALGLLAGVAVAYALWIKPPVSAGPLPLEPLAATLPLVVLTMVRVALFYVRLCLWPYLQSIDYSFDAFEASTTLWDPLSGVVALALALAVVAGAQRAWRAGWRVEVAHGVAFFVALMPVLQIVRHPEMMAEHNLYLPLVAFALGAAQLLQHLALGAVARMRVAAPGTARAYRLVPRLVVIGLCLWIAVLCARTVVRNRDWLNNETLFGSAVRTYPRCARAALGYARELGEAGRHQEALDPLDRALEVLPEGAPWDSRRGALRVACLFERGNARARIGLLEHADEDFTELFAVSTSTGKRLADSSEHAYVILNRAAVRRRLQRPDDAAIDYARVLQLVEPSSPFVVVGREAAIQLAAIRTVAGNHPEAISLLERWAGPEPRPDVFNVWYALARARMQADDLKGSEASWGRLLEALTRTDNDASALQRNCMYLLAEVYERQGRLKACRKQLAELVKRHGEFAAARLSLADVLMRLGDLTGAGEQLNTLLESNPGNESVLAKHMELKILRAAAKAPPSEKRVQAPAVVRVGQLVRMAQMAWRQGQPAAAIAALEKAVAVSGDQPSLVVQLARLYGEAGQLDKAIGLCQRSLGKNPNDATLWEVLGRSALRRGSAEDARLAIHSLSRARDLLREQGGRNTESGILVVLAQAYHKAGERERAREVAHEARATALAQSDLLRGLAEARLLAFDVEGAVAICAQLDQLKRQVSAATEVLADER